MLKIQSGLFLHLPKLFFIGLLLPISSIYSASAQQADRFYCGSHQTRYATFATSSQGTRPMIIWEVRQPFCDEVSRRFQAARDNGNLRFLMIDGNRVCGTNRNGGECRSFLFATNTPMEADSLLSNIRNRDAGLGRFINQSNDDEMYYFNLDLYLNTVSVSSNPEALRNQ